MNWSQPVDVYSDGEKARLLRLAEVKALKPA